MKNETKPRGDREPGAVTIFRLCRLGQLRARNKTSHSRSEGKDRVLQKTFRRIKEEGIIMDKFKLIEGEETKLKTIKCDKCKKEIYPTKLSETMYRYDCTDCGITYGHRNIENEDK